MKNIIFSENWHQLSGSAIFDLFSHFPRTTVLPNQEIVQDLRYLRKASLELLENRSMSTVYRIRQTDQVFQIFLSGEFFLFTTFAFEMHPHSDTLIQRFYTKQIVFKIISREGLSIAISHETEPRFITYFVNHEIDFTEWIDPMPRDVMAIAKLIRKAGAFYSSYCL